MAAATRRLILVLRPLRSFSLGPQFGRFWRRIGAIWPILFVETALLALIPLMVGRSIDGLLANDPTKLFQLAALLVALVAVAVARRVYDTRAYGAIRVALGAQLSRRFPICPSRPEPLDRIWRASLWIFSRSKRRNF